MLNRLVLAAPLTKYNFIIRHQMYTIHIVYIIIVALVLS